MALNIANGMKYRNLLIYFFFWLSTMPCLAETQAGTIRDAEFVIEKQKKNKVDQERKRLFKAPTRSSKSAYNALDSLANLALEQPPIVPTSSSAYPDSMQPAHQTSLWKNYARIGMSNLLLPYFALSLYEYPYRDALWSLQLGYLPPLLETTSTKAYIDLDAKHHIKKWCIDSHFHYQNNAYVHTEANKNYQRRCHQVGTQGRCRSIGSSIVENMQISHRWLFIDNKHNEQLIEGIGRIKTIVMGTTCHIKSRANLAKCSQLKDVTYRGSWITKSNFHMAASKKMAIRVGCQLSCHNDPIEKQISRYALYPTVKISHHFNRWCTPYLGVKGLGIGTRVEPRYIHDLIAKNPFLTEATSLRHRHQGFQIYGGSEGVFAPACTYHSYISLRQLYHADRMVRLESSYLYVVQQHPEAQWLFRLHLFAKYMHPTGRLHATLHAAYQQRVNDTKDPIWWYPEPRYSGKAILEYKLSEQFALTGYADLYAPIILRDKTGHETKQSLMCNLDLRGDYLIAQKWQAFVAVGNLFNYLPPYYMGCHGNRRNITAGIQYRFNLK